MVVFFHFSGNCVGRRYGSAESLVVGSMVLACTHQCSIYRVYEVGEGRASPGNGSWQRREFLHIHYGTNI